MNLKANIPTWLIVVIVILFIILFIFIYPFVEEIFSGINSTIAP